MAYQHLRLEREAPLTERHRRRGFGAAAPADPRGHGSTLLHSFTLAKQQLQQDVGGFDERKLR